MSKLSFSNKLIVFKLEEKFKIKIYLNFVLIKNIYKIIII